MNTSECTLFAAGKYAEGVEVIKADADEDRRRIPAQPEQRAAGSGGRRLGQGQSDLALKKAGAERDVLYMIGSIRGRGTVQVGARLYQDAWPRARFREARQERTAQGVVQK